MNCGMDIITQARGPYGRETGVRVTERLLPVRSRARARLVPAGAGEMHGTEALGLTRALKLANLAKG